MTRITGNPHLIKKINKSLVLDMVKSQGPLSRADVAQRSGLNKGTVSSLVKELMDEELVYEIGQGESSGGRRPVLLLFNEKAGYSIGIDLGVHYILGVLTDLQGNIVLEKQVMFHDKNYSSVLTRIKETILYLTERMPDSRYGLVGIGIGVPGIVDKEGELLFAPNLGWKNIPLKQDIEATFHVPVMIDNEANAGAYGEKRSGAGKDFRNIIYVSAGIGIGVGLILNGELYRGTSGFSGESGHMTIEADGPPCRCGSIGCWELYASEKALLDGASPFFDNEVSLEELLQLAENNHQDVLALLERIGRYLGIGINNLINTFNPEQVIIGNRLSMAKKWLFPAIQQVIDKRTLPFHRANVNIHFSKLSLYSTALGISFFVIEDFLKKGKKIEVFL
ncbi:ROK family protein [Anoxybacillus gonensis]|uniref:ROK family transcriptional regulator n=1 Tax=Anoxybacillus TaxID=150247 RepID=UPI0002DE6F15|nr:MULTISPECIES: ROK family transcriptional regulator [unclassified Anoxybacillus]KGP61149.1 ROK family protein [Anoxybacillus gonensis]THD16669.1 ROK family transcriptional regulator [Anoxybacillus ayderensis]